MTELAPWLLAAAIFAARVADVTLGTIRTIMVFRARRLVAAAIGFVESAIWVVAIAQIVGNLDHWYLVAAYAAGFATGNYVGIWVESRLAIGKELVRVVSYRSELEIPDWLREQGFSVVELEGRRRDNRPVHVLLIVLARRRVSLLIDAVRSRDPEAFFTISDIKQSIGDELDLTSASMTRGGWWHRK